MSLLRQQNSFQATLYEDEFPSLSETGAKDSSNINIISTADSVSYCAKLKKDKDGKIKRVQNEKELYNESICKSVISKSIKTCTENSITDSRFCFKNEKFLGELTDNNPTKKKDSQSSNLNCLNEEKSATCSDQNDEKDNGWIVVKKKIPHVQNDEYIKTFNKTKTECKSVKNDLKITSLNKQTPPQIKRIDSDKRNHVSNNSSNFRYPKSDFRAFVNLKKEETLHKPKYNASSNKQRENISSLGNYSPAVKTFNMQNHFGKEKYSSQNKNQYSAVIFQKNQSSIINKTQQNSLEALSSFNSKKTNSFNKNKLENNTKLCHKIDFKNVSNQIKKDSNKTSSGTFLKGQHFVDSKKDFNNSIPAPSKRKRKSRAKRQAAMQSDKIRIITPEMYSKIMNLSTNEKVQSSKNIATNIYDSNEYPELGSPSIPTLKSENVSDEFEVSSKKDTSKKFSLTIEKSDFDSGIIESSEENSDCIKDPNVSVESNFVEEENSELKKLPVHHNNPITVSLFDMLSVNKSKKKETFKSKEFAGSLMSSKFNLKKQKLPGHYQIVNPLDSSKPAVKRGKEREKPKPKRLSRFKKIILLDREGRKEQILKQYMWNKLYAEKSELPHSAILSDRTNEEELKMLTAEKFSNTETQHLLQLDNRDETYVNVESENLPEDIELFNLYLSLEDNIYEQNLNSCTANINDGEETNLPEQTSIPKLKKQPSCNDLTENIVENETSDTISQIHSNNIEYKLTLESQNKESKQLSLGKSEVHNFVWEPEQGELNKSSTIQNPVSNFSGKSEDSLASLCKDISFNAKLENFTYEPGLTEIQEKLDVSKKFSEEQSLDEELNLDGILCDIQNLFLHKVDDMNNPEGKAKDCGLSETLCYDLKNASQICKNEISNLDTAFTCEKRVNYNFHCTYSEKEVVQAAHIVLHSKKFRDYCTHFSSTELKETVLTLLDDLARFQDRMHQKDPIKARMKRRLIYGIREIKRHTKLKKLKCIIIATDIEDSKTEGGLNDIINELKALAKDYHVPCVFSHLRKKLGQVCHKPAPVSAVGVLNYEGSEVNFKKMLELQSVCKTDYDKVLKSLLSKLTDAQIELLQTTKAKDSANLHTAVLSLLKELYPKSSEIDKSSNSKSIENLSLPGETSVYKEIKNCFKNKDAVETIEINDILFKYKVLS